MNKLQQFLLGLLLLNCTLSFAYAPVVDESENFAVNTSRGPESQQALAHDDGVHSSYFGDTKPQVSMGDNKSEIAKLLNQLEELHQTVQELRGQIDTQNHTIETLKNQQLTLYKDLDDRLTQIKLTPAKQPAAAKTPASLEAKMNILPVASKSQNPADEQISYMAAYNFVEKKDFRKAQLALQEFIQTYPQSGYTPNAEYWLGELYLKNKNYSAAMAHFENVVNNFPSSNKHAACLYKLGASLAANGQMDDAKNKFQAVIQQYPDTDTAKLAQTQLNKI